MSGKQIYWCRICRKSLTPVKSKALRHEKSTLHTDAVAASSRLQANAIGSSNLTGLPPKGTASVLQKFNAFFDSLDGRELPPGILGDFAHVEEEKELSDYWEQLLLHELSQNDSGRSEGSVGRDLLHRSIEKPVPLNIYSSDEAIAEQPAENKVSEPIPGE